MAEMERHKVKINKKQRHAPTHVDDLEENIPKPPKIEEFESYESKSFEFEGDNVECKISDAVKDITNVDITQGIKTLLNDEPSTFSNKSKPIPLSTTSLCETELQEIQAYSDGASSKQEEDTVLSTPRKWIQASAPVVESELRIEVKSDHSQVSSLQTSYINSLSKPIEDKLHVHAVQEIKPYTEIQLSALYCNEELGQHNDVVSEFIETYLRSGKIQHKLHELLKTYIRSRNKLISNSIELEALKKELKEQQSNLWIVETSVVSESGECQDGNPVSASHEYKISKLNQSALIDLTKNLAAIKEIVNEIQSLNSYSSEVLRLQIENYIQTVAFSCPELSKLPHNSPVILNVNTSSHIQHSIQELKNCISILFGFQRRHIKDKLFVSDSREWLSRLVAVLLRIGSWKDHLFLLHHILRCPAGIGSWGAGFIQTPMPDFHQESDRSLPFSSQYVNHFVAVLATILYPVKEREQFLEQVQYCGQDRDSVWVLVDSEGEENEDINKKSWSILKENDLVSLLNQLSMDSLFRLILFIERRDNKDQPNLKSLSQHHLLKLLAFSTVLVRILQQGLRTYDSPRYRQLTKRLGLLIRQVIEYVTDIWILFRTNHPIMDHAMIQRLQVEYDVFFLRATCCIYSSQRLGAWQFLAVIPYSVVSERTLWKLFYLLHCEMEEDDPLFLELINENGFDIKTKLQDEELKLNFRKKLSVMPEAEVFYLLSTFANMAVSRSIEENESFIVTATLDLLELGFICTLTQENYSKSLRNLLTNITSKYPSLISHILVKLQENFEQAGKISIYLFKELPLHLWEPQSNDITLLSHWLLLPPKSHESHLARLILSSLNWSSLDDRSLFLAHQLHFKVALVVLEASLKYCPEDTGSNGLITESVKQVSNIATAMVRPSSAEQVFGLWSWEIMARLRLHALDKPTPLVWTALASPAQAFANIQEPEQIDIIAKGLREKQPLACYVALLATSWGHSLPLLCSHGFSQLHILHCFYKYEALLAVLQHTMPLFLDAQDSLLSCERFKSIILCLVTADRTYMKMAKNLIAPEFPGPILRLLANMLNGHLENFKRYSLADPGPFIRLWMFSLTQINDWTRELSIIYLLDILLRKAFFFKEAKQEAIDILTSLFQQACHGYDIENVLTSNQSTRTFSSLVSWIGGSSGRVSLLPRSSTPEAPWFAYFVLELEFEITEERTGLWRLILKELALATGKANIDQAVKKASNSLKLPSGTSANLAIYRWCQQALDTPIDHPIQPLLWQKFFILYLQRISSISGVPDRGGIGNKFFEGMVNLSFLKKIKKRLQDVSEFYRSKSTEGIDQSQPIEAEEDFSELNNSFSTKESEWYEKCSKLFQTYIVWLEEPRLHEPNVFFSSLPPQYDSKKLILIFQGEKLPWLEYLNIAKIRKSQQNSAWDWQVVNFRTQEGDYKSLVQTPTLENIHDPMQRILKRLKTYESPIPPPSLSNPDKPVIPKLQLEMLIKKDYMFNGLKSSFKSLTEFAQIYSLRTSEHTALDCNFLELIPMLYKDYEMEVTLHAACVSEPPSGRRPAVSNCAGPASIRLKVCEARVNEATEHLIKQNRAEYDNLINRCSQPPPQKVCSASVFVEHVITLLVDQYKESKINNMEYTQKFHDVGAALFFHMLNFYNEETAYYPPTKQFLTTALEMLGQVFISGEESQCIQLLTTMIHQPLLTGILGPHLTPSVASTTIFLQMYTIIVDISYQQASELTFVLLTKFDIKKWLNKNRPRLAERSHFIELVGKALSNGGINPENDKLMVHEIFRQHFIAILKHDFPEHYGELLTFVLKASETQTISVDIWYDLLNGITEVGDRKIRSALSPGRLKDEARKFATEQRRLGYDELLGTASLLATHFHNERLQYGLYGLYPKYRAYIEPITTFLGMIGHGIVVTTLHKDKGLLSDRLSEKLWPTISSLFQPWISPYWTRNLQEPTAAWIQQLTDDRSVLPPWIVNDSPNAHRVVTMFVECLRFISDTLPACSNILSFVWQFYVSQYAHTSIKDHIVNVIHTSLVTLPWDHFWPSIQDVELMLKVVDQYLPDCHSFLGTIFMSVSWSAWLGHIMSSQHPEASNRAHICLLHLFVKLANEPSVRGTSQACSLIQQAQQFQWDLLDVSAYEPVINWCVMSLDPRAILVIADDKINPLDRGVLELLQVAACYKPNITHFHPTTLRKRQMFVRACAKMLVSSASRFKNLLLKQPAAFQSSIRKMLNDIEGIVTASVPEQQQIGEAGLLLSELLSIINVIESNGSNNIATLALDTFVNWLSLMEGSSVVVRGCLRVFTTIITNHEHLSTLLEAALQAYFKQTVSQTYIPDWHQALNILQPIVPRQPPIEDTFIQQGSVLSLYALLLKRLPSCRDIREEANVLENLLDWINLIKPNENFESKLPLLWNHAIFLSIRQVELNGDHQVAIGCLKRLAQNLSQLGDEKAGGLLGVIGLRKTSQVSAKCRLLSKATSVLIFAQMPEGDALRMSQSSPGSVSDDNSNPKPSHEALKGINHLESLLNSKQYYDLKVELDLAITQIQNPENSLHNARNLLCQWTLGLYRQPYLHILKS